jgi:Tfp pilus assembly protein PilF
MGAINNPANVAARQSYLQNVLKRTEAATPKVLALKDEITAGLASLQEAIDKQSAGQKAKDWANKKMASLRGTNKVAKLSSFQQRIDGFPEAMTMRRLSLPQITPKEWLDVARSYLSGVEERTGSKVAHLKYVISLEQSGT